MSYRRSLLISVLAVLALGFLIAETALAQDCGFFDDWCTSDPPRDSAGLSGSGEIVCQFDRRDRPEGVDVRISGQSIHLNPNDSGFLVPAIRQEEVLLKGLAACGLRDSLDPQGNLGAFLLVNMDVTICATRTASADGKTVDHTASFGNVCQSPGTPLVRGTLTAVGSVGNVNPLVAMCPGGMLQNCILNVGIEAGINLNSFTRVCSGGDILTFSEHVVGPAGKLQVRPGFFDACYCNSHLKDGPNGAVDCGQGSNVRPQTITTAGAVGCEFDWLKTPTQDKINISGSPNQVQAAIYDSAQCPIDDIVTSTIRVCNDVKPRQFKIQSVNGRRALSMQIPEGQCADSLSVTAAGVVIDVDVVGAFNDGTRFEGRDDVLTVVQ